MKAIKSVDVRSFCTAPYWSPFGLWSSASTTGSWVGSLVLKPGSSI
jgi:hypothetical protein